MGYTTKFKGEFLCHRPENEHLGAFLKAVREGDLAAVAPLADWLTDRGDPRGASIARLVARGLDDLASLWPLFGLTPAHAAYIKTFGDTRRMKRDAEIAKAMPDPLREEVGLPIGPQGCYFVGAQGWAGQDRDESILDYNRPPDGQPGLWCQWAPNKDGTAIVWDGSEKFYYYVEWLEYLIEHFLAPWGYVVNGAVTWQGESETDCGKITVTDNAVDAVAWG